MKKLNFNFSACCRPKETWFLLPTAVIDIWKGRVIFGLGFLCFACSVEIGKKNE